MRIWYLHHTPTHSNPRSQLGLALLSPADERAHRRVDAGRLAQQELDAGRHDVEPAHPSGIGGKRDMCAPATVDGADDAVAYFHRLDDGGEEGVGGADSVEERGGELAGLDENGLDVGILSGNTKLGGEGAVEGGEAGLGGAVVREVGGAEVTENRGDVDDCATVFGGQHAGEEGLDGVEGGEQVDREGAGDLLGGEFEEGLAVDDGSVVDEDGRGAELVGVSHWCGRVIWARLASISISAATFATWSLSLTSHL